MTKHFANAMTLSRIILSPIFLLCLFNKVPQIITLIIFLLAALTDFVDGWWARKHAVISNFGKIADPIADKALTGAAWIGFSMLGPIPWSATIIILIREIGITVWRLTLVNKTVLAADRSGKWKTTLQIVTISFYILGVQDIVPPVMLVLLWVTVAFTALTGVRYLAMARTGIA